MAGQPRLTERQIDRRTLLRTAGLTAAGLAAVPLVGGTADAAGRARRQRTSRTLYGGSLGGGDVQHAQDTLALWPDMPVARIFDQEPVADWQAQPQLAALPAGTGVIYSFKADYDEVTAGQWDATVCSLIRSRPASSGRSYWTLHHEPDDEPNSAGYRAAWDHLLSATRGVSNWHFRSATILMGWTLNSASGRNVDDWYVPADVLGFDCYHTDAVTQAAQFAQAKGKPWLIGEMGKPLSKMDDAAALAWLQEAQGAWAGYPPPEVACWWNSTSAGDYSFANHPQVLAYLRSMPGRKRSR